MQARDIMTTAVVTVTPDTPVQEVAKTLIERRISAAPVVDKSGKVVGIVSEGDLMRRPETGTEPHHSWWLRMVEMPEQHAAEYSRTHGGTAGDVMTSNVVTVPDDASVGEIAELLESRHIKRVPVVSGGKLVGIVSRSNLLQALAAQPVPAAPKAVDDRALRQKILDAIEKDGGLVAPFVNVIVKDGKAEIWGAAYSDSEKKAIRVAAESVAGKDNVTDRIGVLSPESRRVMWGE
jgi:CBS domain-containing protein